MVTLDIKLPDGTQAPVHAYTMSTLGAAIMIVDQEKGKKGAWGNLTKPHTTKKDYKWKVEFSNSPTVEVNLPKGSTINIYR